MHEEATSASSSVPGCVAASSHGQARAVMTTADLELDSDNNVDVPFAAANASSAGNSCALAADVIPPFLGYSRTLGSYATANTANGIAARFAFAFTITGRVRVAIWVDSLSIHFCLMPQAAVVRIANKSESENERNKSTADSTQQ